MLISFLTKFGEGEMTSGLKLTGDVMKVGEEGLTKHMNTFSAHKS